MLGQDARRSNQGRRSQDRSSSTCLDEGVRCPFFTLKEECVPMLTKSCEFFLQVDGIPHSPLQALL